MTPIVWGGSMAAALVALGAGAYWYHERPDRLTRVIDGDTLVINGSTHVRLWGIDAPELDQPCERPAAIALFATYKCGVRAAAYLHSMFRGPYSLRCHYKTSDDYGRQVSVCYLSYSPGQTYDIAKTLVAHGHALDWPRYSKGLYAADEAHARELHLGVWQGTFEKPWEWRQSHK